MSVGHRLDHFAKWITQHGMTRPSILMKFHIVMLLTNYSCPVADRYAGCYALLMLLVPASPSLSKEDYRMLLFVKLVVWQHLAEGLGCRQGPLMGLSFPNNFLYRLSRGTLKHSLLPALGGHRRNGMDRLVHAIFFLSGLGFLLSTWYNVALLWLLMLCDVYLFVFDMTQFYASSGHAYGSMLLSACFPLHRGRMAGIQLGLILQWFFSGVGKIGPWFEYVNGPFMLQSRLLRGQNWLRRLLIESDETMKPTRSAKVLAHTAAAAEYVAPVLLMIPNDLAIWTGFWLLVAMHIYILLMPAPFDVYSWNLCFCLNGIYLFYLGHFGFDFQSLSEMSGYLIAFFIMELLVCCYGNIWPDQVGYYLSHRYWAGNWVQSFFFVKKTQRVKDKLEIVGQSKGIGNPLFLEEAPYLQVCLGYLSFAYLWLATFNMKCIARLIEDFLQVSGTKSVDEWQMLKLTGWLCGEFRDELYAEKVLPIIQEECKFDEGEAYLIRVGAFGMFGHTATWRIYDLRKGVVREGTMSVQMMRSIDGKPTDACELMMA
ncbi:Uncharacterized protein SCF082_LOCUS5528 [Durusdinium trenchii]|uniref:Uncharacterized protein n=1 Tax=Durusdinium trenchii TaxID=1381693 RepID=A0ABP0I8B6_9DINO